MTEREKIRQIDKMLMELEKIKQTLKIKKQYRTGRGKKVWLPANVERKFHELEKEWKILRAQK